MHKSVKINTFTYKQTKIKLFFSTVKTTCTGLTASA